MADKKYFPDRRWYPQNLAEQVIWWANFAAQFAIIGPTLGFSAGVIAAVQDDNTAMQFYGTTREQAEAFMKAIRKHINDIRELGIGQPTPAWPANPAFSLPEIVATGINQRLMDLVKQIEAASGFTNEIAALLGILPSTPGPTPEGELKPILVVFENIGDFTFKADVTRKGMPMYKIQMQRSGEATWTDIFSGSSNPAVVTVTPLDPTKPERINLRVFLMKNNVTVGAPSDIVSVVISP